MPSYSDIIRLRLSSGPLTSRQLADNMGLSQPTISRALAKLGNSVVRIGSAQSIQYALRDTARGLPDVRIYRVNTDGQIRQLGTLVPVGPNGFVMCQDDGVTRHSDGLPWWLLDMCPQGYLGRAYAARHGAGLGLPPRLTDWNDTEILRALLVHGHDVVGNLLLGDVARDRFLAMPVPVPIPEGHKAHEYAQLAQDAAHGEMPGSSAAGEQPKFTAFAFTGNGPRHVIVKFSEREEGPVSERWRDLLLGEHLALDTLLQAGIPAAKTRIIDQGDQRFLEVERFDRLGDFGRRALLSLTALDAEFIGAGKGGWPLITSRLAADGQILPEAARGAALLWAFGTLIGNTDMHPGNLSFVSEYGRPYALAPAYDMAPMAFAPRSGGGLPDTLQEANIAADVSNETWRNAESLAWKLMARLTNETGFSPRFRPCLSALEHHIAMASTKIARLG